MQFMNTRRYYVAMVPKRQPMSRVMAFTPLSFSALECWSSYKIEFLQAVTVWLTDQLLCSPPPSPPTHHNFFFSYSCTMRMTPLRPQPASSSPALRPQPRPALPAGTPVRTRPARPLLLPQQQRRGRRGRGVRGRERYRRLLMRPSSWEQPLQHPVCGKRMSFDEPKDYFPFLSVSNSYVGMLLSKSVGACFQKY